MIRRIIPSHAEGDINAPSSKSYAQRAIAASLLTEGRSVIHDMELCSDTAAALRVAGLLGARHTISAPGTYVIEGGLNPVATTIDIGESGLSARMFAPIAAMCGVPMTITGTGTLLTRPMEMLIRPLTDLGVKVESHHGHLPITLCGPIRGGETEVDGSVSSQFISGLLMALPLAAGDTTFTVSEARSIPYIDMTLDVLEKFGIEGKHNSYTEFYVDGGQHYRPLEYTIEGDWSGASCLLVAGATAGRVTVHNLEPLSRQADAAIIEALTATGAHIEISGRSISVGKPDVLMPFSFDATHCPDLFPALVALAANCDGVSRIRGTERLRHKESDRALTLSEEYGKMGIEIDTSEPDVMLIRGGRLKSASLYSHRDHRIAMSVAVAALSADGESTIECAEAVEKSYPAFWRDLAAIASGK